MSKDTKEMGTAKSAHNWENFQDEETGKYWDIHSVIYCKLQWLKECEEEERQNIIEDIELYVEAMRLEYKDLEVV